MLGGGIGAVLRALITNICQRLFNSKIPIATSIVNITGSLIIGFMMGHALDSPVSYTHLTLPTILLV